jgi:cell division protein ZapA
MGNHIKLTICGTDYRLVTDDNPEYALALALEVEKKINALREASKSLSLLQATTLVALEYADLLKKNDSSADNLRVQVKEYLEDAAKAEGERDYYKRELERLKADLKSGQTNLFD